MGLYVSVDAVGQSFSYFSVKLSMSDLVHLVSSIAFAPVSLICFNTSFGVLNLSVWISSLIICGVFFNNLSYSSAEADIY